MRIAVTKHSKDISLLHQDIKKTNVCLDLQNTDLGSFKRKIAADGVSLLEKRRRVFMKSVVVSESTPATIEQSMKLPFLRSESLKIYDRLLDVPGVGKWRRNFQVLIEEILKSEDLVGFFGRIPMEAFAGDIPMMPEGVSPLMFFATSTLPALFGFCWTGELQMSYFRLLSGIRKSLGLRGEAFRKHWVFQCYKAYLLSSNLPTYVRYVFRYTVTRLLTVVPGRASMSQRIVDEVLAVMPKLLSALIEKLPVMPRDVRIMLRMLFETEENEQEGLDLVEIVVCECILQLVYQNPKIYGVILDTTQFEKPAFMDGLGKMWSLIRHPDVKDPDFEGLNIEKLFELNFEEVLRAMIDVDNTFTSPSMVSFLDLAGISNVQLLLSVSDIGFLAFLCTFMGAGGEFLLEAAKAISEMPGEIEFCCFRFNLWSLGFYGIPRPIFLDSEWNGTTVDRHQSVQLLCKLMAIAPTRSDEPSDITDFLEYEENRSHVDRDFKSKALLSTLITELAVLHGDVPPILDETFHEIEDRKGLIRSNYTVIADIKEIDEQILALDRESDTRSQELESAIAGMFVLRLLQMKGSIMQTFTSSKTQFVTQRNAFRDFFRSACADLEKLIGPICPYIMRTAVLHLHSHFLRHVPVEKFVQFHSRYKDTDAAFEAVKPLKVAELAGTLGNFKARHFYKASVRELLQARRLEIPLEAIKCVVRSIQALADAIELAGEPPSRRGQLFCRIALSTHAKQLYSFARFLEFFLVDMSFKEVKSILTKEERRALSFVLDVFMVSDRLLSS